MRGPPRYVARHSRPFRPGSNNRKNYHATNYHSRSRCDEGSQGDSSSAPFSAGHWTVALLHPIERPVSGRRPRLTRPVPQRAPRSELRRGGYRLAPTLEQDSACGPAEVGLWPGSPRVGGCGRPALWERRRMMAAPLREQQALVSPRSTRSLEARRAPCRPATSAGRAHLNRPSSSNDPCSPNDAVSEWSPRIPDPQSAPATPPISKKVNAIRNSRSKRGGGQRSPNSG